MIKFTLEDDEGVETEYELPSKKEVCSNCKGIGTHLHPAIREHAYSMEEFQREFDDEEREAYFQRGGMYDVVCQTCHGGKVVDVVDEESCKAEPLKSLLEKYIEHENMIQQMDREDRYTRRMENGGYE